MKSSLMKMVSGVFAALCAGMVWGDYITSPCDLSEKTSGSWEVVNQSGSKQTYTFSSDIAIGGPTFTWLHTYTYTSHSSGSTSVYDLSNATTTYHTFHPNASQLKISASCLPSNGSWPAEGLRSSLTVKNGTLDGALDADIKNKGKLRIGGAWSNGDLGVRGDVLFDHVTIQNFANVECGVNMADSTVTFRDSSITADKFYPFANQQSGKTGLTVTFENTPITIANDNFYSDFSSGIDTPTGDLMHKVIYTGSDTIVYTPVNFLFGNGMPYFQCEVRNGATLRTPNNFYFGYKSSATHGRTIFDHATLQGGWAILVGHEGGHQHVSFNESTLGRYSDTQKISDIYIGYDSDYNTVVFTNCNLSTMGGFKIGGTWENTNAPQHNELHICGQNTTFKGNTFPYAFRGAYGLLHLDNVTLDLDNDTYQVSAAFNPLNTAEGGAVWEKNTMFLDNGTTLKVHNFNLGNYSAGTTPANDQTLIVGDNSTLQIGSMFMNSGVGSTLTVSNGTITTGSEWGFYFGYSDTTTDHPVSGNKLVFQGNHPRIESTHVNASGNKQGRAYVHNGTTVRFDLPDDGAYQQVPFEEYEIDLEAGTLLRFTNLDTVRRSITTTTDIPLMTATSVLHLGSNDILTEANTALDGTQCLVYRTTEGSNAGTLYLRVAPAIVERETAGGTKVRYDSLNTALANLTSASTIEAGDTVRLLSDIDMSSASLGLTSMSPFTLDLNGHNLSVDVLNNGSASARSAKPKSIVVPEGSTLTVASNFIVTGGGNRFELAGTMCIGGQYSFYYGGTMVDDGSGKWNVPKPDDGVANENTFIVKGASPHLYASIANAQFLFLYTQIRFEANANWFNLTDPLLDSDRSVSIYANMDSITVSGLDALRDALSGTETKVAPLIGLTSVPSSVYSGVSALSLVNSTLKLTISKATTDLGGGFSAVTLDDGTCSITGSGELTAAMVNNLSKQSITSLTLGSGISSIAEGALEKCYNLQSVTCQYSNTPEGGTATGISLAKYAFYRCFSLTEMNFAAMPTLGENSITMQAAIYMKDGLPSVYPIPEIKVSGYHTELVGTNELKGNDTVWTVVDPTDATARGSYHFFKLRIVANSQD